MVLISGVLLNQLSIKHKYILSIRQFSNEKGYGAEMHPAIVFGIVSGDAPGQLLANWPFPSCRKSLFQSEVGNH